LNPAPSDISPNTCVPSYSAKPSTPAPAAGAIPRPGSPSASPATNSSPDLPKTTHCGMPASSRKGSPRRHSCIACSNFSTTCSRQMPTRSSRLLPMVWLSIRFCRLLGIRIRVLILRLARRYRCWLRRRELRMVVLGLRGGLSLRIQLRLVVLVSGWEGDVLRGGTRVWRRQLR